MVWENYGCVGSHKPNEKGKEHHLSALRPSVERTPEASCCAQPGWPVFCNTTSVNKQKRKHELK